MSSTYIHTQRTHGTSRFLLKTLALIYVAAIAVTIIYLWNFTQNRYATYAAFKIAQQNGSSSSSGLVSLAIPGMTDSGSMDSQIAIGFIGSADLLVSLEKEFKLIEHYSAPQQDWVFRLNPKWPLEERLDFYRGRIFSHFDKDTGLTAVTVDTFDPKLSHQIAVTLLGRAESFINELNQEIADQQVGFIKSELERAAQKVEDLNRELLTLQNENKFITPNEVISANLHAVQEMKLNQLRSEAQLSSLQRDSPNSPKIEVLQSQIRSVNELIEIESAKLTGPEKDRLSQLLIRFKELELKIEFATRLRSGAETLLERNRVEAASRTRFFSVIQKPYVPEDVAEPRRWYATISILILGFLVFLIARALTLSVFESS